MRLAGFTLLELLVALLVLGFVFVGLAEGARYGLGAAGRQAAVSDTEGELDAVDRTLRRIAGQADPLHPLVGTQGTLSLVSSLPDAEAASDIGLGVETGRGLVLRWTPHLAGRALAPPPPPRETVLLSGVAGVALSYWAVSSPAGWRASWTGQELPALIRLRVTFPSGDPRRWPDIVVAPQRQSPRLRS